MILNELSYTKPAKSIHAAKNAMKRLVMNIKCIGLITKSRVLRTKTDISNLLLFKDYPLAKWRNDKSVDLEARRYFRLVTTKAPYLSESETQKMNELKGYQAFCGDVESEALTIAYLFDFISLSIMFNQTWNRSWINIRVVSINALGDIEENEELVRHVGIIKHVKEHEDWLRNKVFDAIHTGSDILENRENLFGVLEFCDGAIEGISSLGSGDPLAKKILNKLCVLDKYFTKWTSGPFDPSAIGGSVSPDSEATLNKYRDERTFSCTDGTKITFSWHMKVNPGAWRLYFEPIGPRRCIIGYVGPHLRTVKYDS